MNNDEGVKELSALIVGLQGSYTRGSSVCLDDGAIKNKNVEQMRDIVQTKGSFDHGKNRLY